MRTFKMQDSQFGAPVGVYKCKFVEAVDREHPEYGPGVEWLFEIVEGPQRGKRISRTTSQEPSLKNACGRILQGLTGGVVGKDAEVEISRYVGQLYSVMVEANSTGNGTRIGTVMPFGSAGPTPPTPPAPKPPPGAGPSPLAGDPQDKFWCQLGTEVRLLTRAQIYEMYAQDPKLTPDLPCMSGDQSSGWQTAADFRLHEIPF